jgi:mono/diheme cytochrome c family protein
MRTTSWRSPVFYRIKRLWAAALCLSLGLVPVLDAEKPPAASEIRVGAVPRASAWSAIRQEYYHKPQGTKFIPLSWFLALEQKGASGDVRKPFNEAPFLGLFGFLPDRAGRDNPHGLPIGFTKTNVPGLPAYLGFNCAFCHTGQIAYTDRTTYKRHVLRIDGAPSMQFNARFVKELLEALKVTLEDARKFKRFHAAVTAQDPFYKKKTEDQLRQEVMGTLQTFVARSTLDPLEWGFGRFDALGNGGNAIFLNKYPEKLDNFRVANAPVSIPSIWGTTSYARMQWNGTAHNFLARSVAEALSAGASPQGLDLTALQWMEAAVATMEPPPWPDVFPPIDYDKAHEGQKLYRTKCQRCHEPDERADVPMLVPVADIGTDPLAAMNYANRKVDTGDGPRKPAAEVMQELTQQIIAGWLAKHPTRTAGRNPNRWQNEPGYVARPLVGVWATPPYLHNGSVPNLYQLLSPANARSQCFYVDDREYDPVRVGFLMKRCDFQSKLDDPSTGFELDTARLGNYNSGHEFTNYDNEGRAFTPEECAAFKSKPRQGVLGCELSDDQRWALIEYLKSLSDHRSTGG